MKKIKNKIFHLKYGMMAPQIFIRILGKFVFIWWGKKSGLETRIDWKRGFFSG